MKREQLTVAFVALVFTGLGQAVAQSSTGAADSEKKQPSCVSGPAAEKLRSSQFFQAVWDAFRGPQCANVVRVLSELQSKPVAGGRKLHDKPFDRAAAQKELQAARADSEFVAKLGPALQGISDANARKVVEAAVLEDLGFFGARQLLMEELAQVQGAR